MLKRLHDNSIFQWFVIFIIIASSLSIGARTYSIDPTVEKVIHYIDYAITLFFVLEILIRIAAEKTWYHFFRLKNGWNWFDLIIVIGSLVPVDGNFILLGRLLRLFRVMRLISFIPQLRILTKALFTSIPRMGYVLLMMFVIFYIYAAFGSIMFEYINPALWGDIGSSLLTLFRVATLEDWTDVMYETMQVYRYSWIYFLTFIFLSTFVFLNMMIGIVINVLDNEHKNTLEQTEDSIEQRLSEIENTLAQIKSHIVHTKKS